MGIIMLGVGIDFYSFKPFSSDSHVYLCNHNKISLVNSKPPLDIN